MNLNLFNTWTDESAYFLGVIAIIGNSSDTVLTVKAPHANREWFRRVASIIGLKKVSAGNTFSISSVAFIQTLLDMKDKHGSLPEAVDEAHFKHFVRGMFDAGGRVNISAVFTGRLKIITKTRQRLIDLGVTSDTSWISTPEEGILSELTYSGPDVQKLGHFMYNGAGDLCIQQKKDAFELDKEGEQTDEPRELHRHRSERPASPRRSCPVLRPRVRGEPDYDSMVW